MLTSALWFAACGPLVLACAGFIRPAGDNRSSCSGTVRWVSWAAVFACFVALATGLAVLINGPLRTGTIGIAGVGFGLYLDALSALMYALVSFIGTIVVLYSRNYLDGQTTLLQTKNGLLPEANLTLDELFSTYGETYDIYRRRPSSA